MHYSLQGNQCSGAQASWPEVSAWFTCQQLAHSNHAVQGGSNFMGHPSEELTFCLGRCLGLHGQSAKWVTVRVQGCQACLKCQYLRSTQEYAI